MAYHTVMPLERLKSERLELSALDCDELRGLLERRVKGLELADTLLSLSIERAVRIKLEKMAHVGLKDHVWFTYWLIVLRESERGIGLVGFKGIPDECGEVDIGYGLTLEYEGQGYMSEAVRSLIGWAFSQKDCAVIAPSTAKTNLASRRVLEKVGMTVYQETAGERFWRLEKGKR